MNPVDSIFSSQFKDLSSWSGYGSEHLISRGARSYHYRDSEYKRVKLGVIINKISKRSMPGVKGRVSNSQEIAHLDRRSYSLLPDLSQLSQASNLETMPHLPSNINTYNNTYISKSSRGAAPGKSLSSLATGAKNRALVLPHDKIRDNLLFIAIDEYLSQPSLHSKKRVLEMLDQSCFNAYFLYSYESGSKKTGKLRHNVLHHLALSNLKLQVEPEIVSQIIQKTIELGLDIEQKSYKNSYTPLGLALAQNNSTVARELIKHQANVGKVRDDKNSNAFRVLVTHRNTQLSIYEFIASHTKEQYVGRMLEKLCALQSEFLNNSYFISDCSVSAEIFKCLEGAGEIYKKRFSNSCV